MPSKEERLLEIFRRLRRLPPASNLAEALGQVTDTVNRVEDELSGIPNNPAASESDGRLYPPSETQEKSSPRPRSKRYRARRHNTIIGENGAIEIRVAEVDVLSGKILFSKAGSDGKGVKDL